MPGIATNYKGVEYRSRLEARWACFFDLIGWKYEYEPFDLNYYMPDFLLHGDDPVLVEVKPYTTRDEFAPLEANLPESPYPYLIVGAAPFLPGLSRYADVLGRTLHSVREEERGWWADAEMGHCHKCESFYFVHGEGAWVARGVIDGCGDCRKPGLSYETEALVRGLWARAQNLTKWAA